MRLKRLLLLCILPLATHSAAAQEDMLLLQLENDQFAGTDRHYTSGVRVTYFPDALLDGWAENLNHRLSQAISTVEGHAPRTQEARLGFVASHRIYTPRDVVRTTLQREDRPYAGWFDGGLILTRRASHRLDTLQLSVGVVGEAAEGERIQNNVHDLLGGTIVRGWEHQLENEPTVQLSYLNTRRYPRGPHNTALSYDILPHYGATVGNALTYANIGAQLRVGWNLPDHFGHSLIRPAMIPRMPEKAEGDGLLTGWRVYIFGGVDGRAVARNIFLDGNTFSDSHSVDKKHFVGEAYAGGAIAKGNWTLSFSQAIRTREFDGQDENHEFGSVQLSVRF